MRIRSLILAGFLLCGHLSFAQGDGCRGALSALVRVKEQITPTLNASTESGRERLSVMLSTLKNATNLCKEFPDLWYYRTVIARQLGKPDAYAEKKLQELSYVAQYDPFKLPQAAEEPEKQESPTHVRKKWALVIGIDQYQDERVPRLNFAVKDSQDFEEFLKDPEGGRFDPANIIHLVDQKATLTGIRQALGKLRAQVQKDDLVVLYFSGHGSPREMDPNGMSYIITNDTSLDGPENLYATSLQMIDLVQQVNRDIKARRVVLFLDTCYSGDAQRVDDEEAGSARGIAPVWDKAPPLDAPASMAFSQAFNNLMVGYGRAVLTASRADEQSWESPVWKNGYFTHFLISQLRQSRGNASLDDLFHQVQGDVSSQVLRDYHVHQTPSFQFSESGAQIVIGRPEGK